ncbi:hypothetical protein TNCV_1302301 [Trichonephila clavipes]|nr:hypothetical protein TNCV_1302301 [Trichonephila clavipes]
MSSLCVHDTTVRGAADDTLLKVGSIQNDGRTNHLYADVWPTIKIYCNEYEFHRNLRFIPKNLPVCESRSRLPDLKDDQVRKTWFVSR